MTFIDGILIASCVWFVISLLALMRGMISGADIDIDASSELWDNAFKTGFTTAYVYADNPDAFEKLATVYLDPVFLEMLKENENAECIEGNPDC